MVKQFFKKRSKRVSTRTRTKIERKVREHNRKLKKESKKNPTKKKKDPGVPNSYPFKEEVLREAERRKQEAEAEKQKQKEKRKQERQKERKKERQKLIDKKRNLTSMVSDAQKRTEDFDRKKAFVETKTAEFKGGKAVENSLKQYYKEFRKVVEAADVVIQVLDARDPLGSRCPQVEEAVISAGPDKRLVLLLNKIDLVPKENVEAWLKYLKNEYPTVPFKASTQEQSDKLSHSKVAISKASDDVRKSSACLGADVLLKLLGNYCRNKDIKTAISVGIVGFPNTGKSSIINSLKRSKACNVGATPGVTKSLQQVQLDKHVKLLDSPGIVMATGNTDSQVILRNCVRVESLEDPVTPVAAIMKRCPKDQMMMQYNVPEFSDVEEFLVLLAKRMGQLRKGGVPNTTKAARKILQDWNSGKIRYYTHPPEHQTSHLSADIVTSMGKEFSIDSLLSDEQSTLSSLKTAGATDMVIDTSGPMAGATCEADVEEEMSSEEDKDEEMEGDDDIDELENVVVETKKKKSKKTKDDVKENKLKKDAVMAIKGNQQMNKDRKKAFKQMKKQRKRNDAVAGNLSNALEGAFASLGGDAAGEDYDFSENFK